MATFKTYIKAARLRTLPLSVSGIIVGSALAYVNGFFRWDIFGLALLTTLCFQILSNFANDYGDGIKGTDNAERIGPQRAVQSGEITAKQMKNIITITIILTLIIAFTLIFNAFGTDNLFNILIFSVLGLASITAAIKYTVGNKAYGYSGWGDVFVFLFFGWLSVVGSNYLFTKNLHWTLFLPATAVGLLSVGVLHLNNMRDSQADKKSGKITLAVKLGKENSKKYFYYLIGFSLLFSVFYVNYHYHSAVQFLFILAFIPLIRQVIRVIKNDNPAALDPELKILALSTFAYALLFSLGQILSLNEQLF